MADNRTRAVRAPRPTLVGDRVVVPVFHGVTYKVGDKVVRGSVPVNEASTVTAVAQDGHRLTNEESSWNFGESDTTEEQSAPQTEVLFDQS